MTTTPVTNSINTVFSANSDIENETLIDAKRFMNEHYGNKYSHIPPHISYTIMPLPEYNFERAKDDLIAYVIKQKPYLLKLSDLKFDNRDNLFYIEVSGKDMQRLHEDITILLNKHREGFIREKDLERISKGYFNDNELEYLRQYGYSRVFECFRPHISIGNFTVENVDVPELTKILKEKLTGVLNKSLVLNNIRALFHTDAGSQQEAEVFWESNYLLS
ncbi:DUF1045 domain-containing protein [Candidatus Nomurabacteria bacterium]|uniref:DUF1045 domain-containing protein n=1 Tax=candidate division WWE3 bacterium TaxID=2053526 RepID=A0A955E001_UNCKA|nr:DUF1045 domain-containing protein [candidate division WWE3 bacterium]MCB9824061.1 DUF1045 domain-containing protein [Candidatus Nomurabacteria bacterium]MCB9826968.1 DUF1045 domain-containing protein [Candidatus Nomurabacteria bacterium]MCB9828002.1 DUF1045 domain-containing protein [Candidatus Nomurabacteria bacterium]HXK52845.1 DUF1045 domain-containing protein [bacterium]